MAEDKNEEKRPTEREQLEKGLVVYTPQGSTNPVTLTTKIVQDFFCANATPLQAMAFMGYCKGNGLDPFKQEVFLSVFDEKPVIQTAYRVFMKRAEQSRQYKSFKAGIVLLKEEQEAITFPGEEVDGVVEPFVAIQGTLVPPGYELVGGWCKVWRKDRGPEPAATSVVSMKEYMRTTRDRASGDLRPMRMWAEEGGKPATMIRKVAVAAAHREAFSGEVGNLITEGEIQPALPARGEVVEIAPDPVPVALKPLFDRLGWRQAQVTMWLARYRGRSTEQMQDALAGELGELEKAKPAPEPPRETVAAVPAPEPEPEPAPTPPSAPEGQMSLKSLAEF